ncbi:MAG: hypothetical protein NC200_06940 [Candidatus Gastranaerophilales bacterium]|nr:hypothetical protein [Candidatus Gastranaerophilales bacterium]
MVNNIPSNNMYSTAGIQNKLNAESRKQEHPLTNEESHSTQKQEQAYLGRDLVIDKTSNNSDLSVVFKKLEGKKGADFANTAYKELVKLYGLSDVAPKELSWEQSEGRPIVSDYRWYENKVVVYKDYFEKATPEEQLGYIAHELTHCKQTTNILRTEGLPVQSYAMAIATSDFRANVINNPTVKANFQKAMTQGKEKEYAALMIRANAANTYKELTTVFADVLNLPKHSLQSENGQKALNDLRAQATYNGADMTAYNNCELEKEAMSVENDIKQKFLDYKKSK